MADFNSIHTGNVIDAAVTATNGISANTTHRGSDGKDHSDVVLNNTHRGSTGADHTYIDQSVINGATPTLTGTNFSGIPLSALIQNPTESFLVVCSDETTDLTTGTSKVTFRMPYAFTVTEVRANVNTAPAGSTIIVDINETATTILSTKLSIDASEKTSETAVTPPIISDSALADDAEITIDIDQIGSSTSGKGLKVTLIGRKV